MSDRRKLGLKAGSPTRDPRRAPVRGGATGPLRDRSRPAPSHPETPPRGTTPAPPSPLGGHGGAQRGNNDRAPIGRPGPRAPAPHIPTQSAEGPRLSRVMADRGIASRREADAWIEAGWVRVDGRVAVLGQRVRGDEALTIDPAARREQARRVTILLNKPLGHVSGQAEDGHPPAAALVTAANRWAEDRGLPWHPGHARGLAPAGRLDIDSTGLLVLTQDGRIARHLIGEDSDVEKEYLVRVEPLAPGSFAADGIERLRHGLELDGRALRPARVSWANEDQLRVVLREGRKRQIRRMCELVGLKVVALKRVRIGSVVLGKLPPGQWRYLRDDERF
jgi:23S rRNA pseudouridine2604 synthase